MKIFACKASPAKFDTWIMMDVLEWLIGLHGNLLNSVPPSRGGGTLMHLMHTLWSYSYKVNLWCMVRSMNRKRRWALVLLTSHPCNRRSKKKKGRHGGSSEFGQWRKQMFRFIPPVLVACSSKHMTHGLLAWLPIHLESVRLHYWKTGWLYVLFPRISHFREPELSGCSLCRVQFTCNCREALCWGRFPTPTQQRSSLLEALVSYDTAGETLSQAAQAQN